MAITGIGQAVSATYNSFIFFAFLNAVGTAGVFPLAFIIGIFVLLFLFVCSKSHFTQNLLFIAISNAIVFVCD